MPKLYKLMWMAVMIALVMALAPRAGAAQQPPSKGPTFHLLKLLNGWRPEAPAPFDTRVPAVALISGVVYFKGAMRTAGTNSMAFVLPPPLRPPKSIYVPVDMCNATNGRLEIAPNGVVRVTAESSFSQAQCLTSLDGASFVRGSSPSFKLLKLQNGWSGGPYGTSAPAVGSIGGVVHFRGALWQHQGQLGLAFILPAPFRPRKPVYLPVDQCEATGGRLAIAPDGSVIVQAEKAYASAQCFTSLDGASLVPRPGRQFKPIALDSGWHGGAFGTSMPSAAAISGIVRFAGAMDAKASAGESVFALGPALSPLHHRAYVRVDLCNGASGRLVVFPHSGSTTVNAQVLQNARCFTSLDGAWFAR